MHFFEREIIEVVRSSRYKVTCFIEVRKPEVDVKLRVGEEIKIFVPMNIWYKLRS